MILAKVLFGGNTQWTVVEGDSLFAVEGDVYGDFVKGALLGSFSDAKLLAPADPTTIICCGLNYYDTLEQLQIEVPEEPALFYKPLSALVNPGEDTCTIPAISNDPRYEAELCAVMKRRAWKVTEAQALDYVLGYTCGNDMTLWDLYQKDGRLTRAKGYFRSAPLGPVLVTDINPNELHILGKVNGEVIQDGNTNNQIFSTARIISHVSQFVPLEPGDVVFTGTPKGGHHPVKVGDVIEVEIDGIGLLRSAVTTE